MHEFEIRMYVLRLWHEGATGAGPGVWRASLLNPLSHRRRYFSDLSRLAEYLTAFDPAWPDEEEADDEEAEEARPGDGGEA